MDGYPETEGHEPSHGEHLCWNGEKSQERLSGSSTESKKRRSPGATTSRLYPSLCHHYGHIDKALAKLDKKDPAVEDAKVDAKLPKELKDLRKHFLNDEGASLPPHRPGKDHAIDLTMDEQGREKDPPWGPLYGMSRDELLVLRRPLPTFSTKDGSS